MIVVNIAEYDFRFPYKSGTIVVPYDYKPYNVPDDIGSFKELKVLIPPQPYTTQEHFVDKFKSEENIITVNDIDLVNTKVKKTKKPPLKGVKIKKTKRKDILNKSKKNKDK